MIALTKKLTPIPGDLLGASVSTSDEPAPCEASLSDEVLSYGPAKREKIHTPHVEAICEARMNGNNVWVVHLSDYFFCQWRPQNCTVLCEGGHSTPEYLVVKVPAGETAVIHTRTTAQHAGADFDSNDVHQKALIITLEGETVHTELILPPKP